MSHFVVGVIMPKDATYDTLEDMLKPYDECLEVDFKDLTEEIREKYLNNTVTMYRTEDDDLIAEYSSKIPLKQKEGGHSWEKEKDIPEEWVKIEVPCSVLYPTMEEYVDKYGYNYSEGKSGYWYNSKAKWDWWVVGGRWDGYFNGANTINVRDYDTSIDIDKYNKYLNLWKEWENGRKFSFDEDEGFDFAFYKPEYLKERYKNAETYARFMATPWMRAIITPDGKWHEVGEIGWWGCSDETGDDLLDWVDHFAERFILPYSNGDYEIVAVDCHI